MSDELAQQEEAAEEQLVLQYMGAVVDKVLEVLRREGADLEGEELRQRIVALLKGEEGARELMGAAFSAGFEVGQLQQGDPTWSDVEIPGERKARWREQHLCLGCAHAVVCAAAKALQAEHLQVLRKCLEFVPKSA